MARRVPEAPAPEPRAPESSEAPVAAKSTGIANQAAGKSRLLFLPPDWLPVALVIGDAVIAAVSVPAGYWIKYQNAIQALPLRPYVEAIPVVVALYLFSLALTGQYRSWRGRTLVDQLFALYTGVGLAAVLMLAAIEAGNLGQSYCRL